MKQDEGQYYITGKGCGTKNPLKYLYEIPDNIQENPCSIISKLTKVEMKPFKKKMLGCFDNWNGYNNQSCYFASKVLSTFLEAQEICEGQNGHLIEQIGEEMQDKIQTIVEFEIDDEGFWVGYKEEGSKWVRISSGEEIEPDWASNLEPINDYPYQKFGKLKTGKINDEFAVICQRDKFSKDE